MNLQENIQRIKQVMGLLKEYEEQQPDIKSSIQNGFIFIDSISQVPKVGVPMNKEEFKADDISSISWDNIVIVRATDELPTVNKGYMVMHTNRALKTLGFGGEYMKKLRKKWEEEGWKDIQSWEKFFNSYKNVADNRWTKHFTLNHMVDDNMGGSWKDLSFVYLMPGKETVSLNGKPTSLYSIDTWYTKSVVVPKNTVVLYSPKVKDKIEQMSIQFNSELSGSKLKYPVYFLQINSKEDVNKVIESMGYSTIVGGAHYSVEDNIDSEIRDFGKSEDQPIMGIHANTLWSSLEQGNVSTTDLFNNLDYLKEKIKNPEKLNDWYNTQRRIIGSYLDKIFEESIKEFSETKKYNDLLITLDTLKTKINDYPTMKKFKTDVLNAIERNNIKEVLKNIAIENESGITNQDEFINQFLPN
jgi:hypothetical protein